MRKRRDVWTPGKDWEEGGRHRKDERDSLTAKKLVRVRKVLEVGESQGRTEFRDG